MSSLNDLITGEKIKSSLVKRNKAFDIRTLSAANLDSLKKKLVEEKKEGWEFTSKIKSRSRKKQSYKIQKERPLSDQLEDELWCIAAGMGFKELSDGYKFEILDDTKDRQIDVFAKDDESAIYIECTQAKEEKKKSMESLINKIAQTRKAVCEKVRKHYSSGKKLKHKYIIATRRIIWKQNDLDKAHAENIHVIRDGEIDYYKKLIKHLKGAARFQFLAHVFSGSEVPGLKIKIPATRGNMGGKDIYSFFMTPADLLKISYIAHREKPFDGDIESYQRMVQPKRLTAIAKYINEGGGGFPTNIVVNFRTKRPLIFDQKQKYSNGVIYGDLSLPDRYASAGIIDGQHRLYGYEFSDYKEKATVPVLAFVNLSDEEAGNLFIDINCEQVKVRKSLFQDIISDLHWASDDPKEKLEALESRIVKRLNSEKTSPLHNRIKLEGAIKTQTCCITPPSIADVLKETKLIGQVAVNTLETGFLSTRDPDDVDANLRKAVSIISLYLNLFKEANPDNWENGDALGVGYICTSNAIRAQIKVLKEICTHCRNTTGMDLRDHEPEEFFGYIKEYAEPVADFFKTASMSKLQEFRQYTGQKGVSTQAHRLMHLIQKQFKDFTPAGLNEFIAAEVGEYRAKARDCCQNIELQIKKFVKRKLKEKFHDKWEKEGIPVSTRKEAAGIREGDSEYLELTEYLYLKDWTELISYRWKDCFDEYFMEKPGQSKKVSLAWVPTLLTLRNKTAHQKGSVSKEELDFTVNLEKKINEIVKQE
jgi:DNA sulfur modification protein DndB